MNSLLLLSLIALVSSSPIPPPTFRPRGTRFTLSTLRAAHHTPSRPAPASLFGALQVSPAAQKELAPYAHPRIVFGAEEWHQTLQKRVDTFDKDGSFTKTLWRITKDQGPLRPFVEELARLERDGITNLVDNLSAEPTEHERNTLKELAQRVQKTEEVDAQALFLCAYWAGVSERQPEGAKVLPSNATETCVLAAVAWSKVLVAHRAYHCRPTCTSETEGGDRSYLWNTQIKWSVSNDWYTLGSTLGLAYDVLYDKMTDGQRESIRSALGLLVMRRFVWGTVSETTRDIPNAQTHPHRIWGNWAMYHSNLYLTNLAIEGESGFTAYAGKVMTSNEAKGFNVDMNAKFGALIEAYMLHTIYPDGSTFEDGYTYHIALREGSFGLLASQRRGSGVLDTDRFRNTIFNAAQMFEPWQCGSLVGHSSGGGLSYPTFVALFRYAYPDGPLPRMLWAQRVGKEFENDDNCRMHWIQSMTHLAIMGDEHKDAPDNIADSPDTLAKNVKALFPLGYVSTRRGLIISRGSHSQRTSYTHFDARSDSFFLGHDNADRGVITYSALKTRWFDDLDWKKHGDSRSHSLMHVDGLAQAQKAPSVTIMKADDTPTSFIAAADLTYAYNVQWAQAWQGPSGGSTTNVEYDTAGKRSEKLYKFTEAEDCSPWDLGWPMEDDASDIGFNRSMTLNGYPDLAFGGMFQWKRNYRKELLNHMVRSTATVRSDNNDVGFTLLVDAVDAQRGEHTFESYLVLGETVSVDSKRSSCTGTSCKVVLSSGGVEQLDVHVRANGELTYRVEEFEGNNRLVVKSKGVREEFWMAFHPHEGDTNGFEMTEGDDGEVRFSYEGEQRAFKLDTDHTVVEV